MTGIDLGEDIQTAPFMDLDNNDGPMEATQDEDMLATQEGLITYIQ